MELYLKRYYWVAIVLTIAASAWLVARTANTFVGSAIEPAPMLGLDDVAHGPSALPPVVTADATDLGHLFGIIPPAPVVLTAEEMAAKEGNHGPSNVCMTCDPVRTALRLQLLATMVASEPEFSTALITDLDKGDTNLFEIHDIIRGANVHAIIRDPQRVVIINNDTHRLEFIDGTPGTGVLADTKLPGLGVAPVPAPGGSDGIRKVGDNQFQISREKLDSTLANMNDLATQARIVPSYDHGQADGFKLFSIQPGSVYSQIGIQNGDVIERINGYDINSPEKALEAYSRLKDSSDIQIQVKRNGQSMNMGYQIQ